MAALRTLADYFKDETHPGDVLYHNDPAWSGSHIVDCCMYKPVFYKDELVFWTVSKGHVTDIGGPVPAGYNPEAKEIYAEGLRIPPLKIYDRGKERRDVVNLLLTNVRSRRLQAGDMRAQLAAVTIGERNLVGLLEKYGKDTVQACIAELLNLAERQMRKFIADIPDGTYHGSSVLEDAGHGFGDIQIAAEVTVTGDAMHVRLSSPPQIPYFINSYASNSLSGVYLGVMMFAQLPPPYNEGLYRAIAVDVGPEGTITHAKEPAPHVNCTTTPSETITDAVRMALEEALPERAVASWGHSNGFNIAGHDFRTGEEYVSMILATIISVGRPQLPTLAPGTTDAGHARTGERRAFFEEAGGFIATPSYARTFGDATKRKPIPRHDPMRLPQGDWSVVDSKGQLCSCDCNQGFLLHFQLGTNIGDL